MRGAKLNQGIFEVRLIVCEQVVRVSFSGSHAVVGEARSYQETQVLKYPFPCSIWILPLHHNSNAENVVTQVLRYRIPNQGMTLEVKWMVQAFREMCERFLDIKAQVLS
jgi:hypothetical protein